MDFNNGKYEPKVVKETIEGKEVKCSICGLDGESICLEIGPDFIFKILTAIYSINEEGYWWQLVVAPIDPNTPIITLDKFKSCVITDLKIIDNFYEQLS